MFKYFFIRSFNLSLSNYRTLSLKSFSHNVINQRKLNYSKNYSTNLSNINNIINDKYKVYSGPLSGTTKKLKAFSIASLITAIAISPIIMIVDAPILLEVRTILIVMTISTSALSTGLIHLCLSPYVRNIYYKPSITSNDNSKKNIEQTDQSSTFEISSPKITPDSFLTFETLTLLGRTNFTTLPIRSLEPSFRFFTTWKVNKLYENDLSAMTKKGKQLKPKKLFYIHSEMCDNKVMKAVINKVGIFGN